MEKGKFKALVRTAPQSTIHTFVRYSEGLETFIVEIAEHGQAPIKILNTDTEEDGVKFVEELQELIFKYKAEIKY